MTHHLAKILPLIREPSGGWPTEAEIRTRERAAQGDLRRARIADSGIAGRLEDGDIGLVLGDLDRTPAYVRVESWIRQLTHPEERRPTWGPWLWLGGPRGVGKTLAAAWAIAEVGGRYTTMRGLIEDTAAEHRRRSGLTRGPGTWHSRYAAQCLLVLDEVGQEDAEGRRDVVEAARAAARHALHELVDHRRRRSTPTLVLSNKSAASIRERFASGIYDARTESRLRQVLTRDRDTGAGLHDVGGEDRRGGAV